MNLTHQEHKAHIKITPSGLPPTSLQSHCETCSKCNFNFVWWDQIHQDWEAVRDELAKLHGYVDTIEPELVRLRELGDILRSVRRVT